MLGGVLSGAPLGFGGDQSLLIGETKFAQALLDSSPRFNAAPNRGVNSFRNIISSGLTRWAAIADIHVRAVLGSTGMASALGVATRPVGLRDTCQQRVRDEVLHFLD